jgi:hypothetical protein
MAIDIVRLVWQFVVRAQQPVVPVVCGYFRLEGTVGESVLDLGDNRTLQSCTSGVR